MPVKRAWKLEHPADLERLRKIDHQARYAGLKAAEAIAVDADLAHALTLGHQPCYLW